jgi:hypothetical protein
MPLNTFIGTVEKLSIAFDGPSEADADMCGNTKS